VECLRVSCGNADGDFVITRASNFPPALGLTNHEDNNWTEGEKHHSGEHEGKGYWKGDNWRDE
jgi:hypothetical protein